MMDEQFEAHRNLALIIGKTSKDSAHRKILERDLVRSYIKLNEMHDIILDCIQDLPSSQKNQFNDVISKCKLIIAEKDGNFNTTTSTTMLPNNTGGIGGMNSGNFAPNKATLMKSNAMINPDGNNSGTGGISLDEFIPNHYNSSDKFNPHHHFTNANNNNGGNSNSNNNANSNISSIETQQQLASVLAKLVKLHNDIESQLIKEHNLDSKKKTKDKQPRKRIIDGLNSRLEGLKFHITNLKSLQNAMTARATSSKISDKEVQIILSQVEIIVNKNANVLFGAFEKIYDQFNSITGAQLWKNFDSQSLIANNSNNSFGININASNNVSSTNNNNVGNVSMSSLLNSRQMNNSLSGANQVGIGTKEQMIYNGINQDLVIL